MDQISFTIEPGKTVAIVGETGAGKSTITQLLMRFYQCDSGNIFLNSIDITQVKHRSLLNCITVVSQEANLFNDTVFNNIKYGNLKASDEDVKEAAYYAGLIDQDDSEDFLNRAVGERGQQISGGQKQRIAIARACLKGGLILILDEPTSALDPETEKAVQKNLVKISRGATTLLITHKLYTLVHADKIYYLENNHFVEQGTFQELVEFKRRFFEQLKLQCEQLGISLEDIQLSNKQDSTEEEELDFDSRTKQYSIKGILQQLMILLL